MFSKRYDVEKLRVCAMLGLTMQQISVVLGLSPKTARKALKEQGLYRGWDIARRRQRRSA